MNNRIILISGFARSGKDTLADALKRRLQHVAPATTKFALPLREALAKALKELGLHHVNVWTEDPAEKALLRPLLKEFGRYCRRLDKDVFVKATLQNVAALHVAGWRTVLIPDCRYLNEAQLVRAWGHEREIAVHRLHIVRSGNEAANDEEEQSIAELQLGDKADATSTFAAGDVDGIDLWAASLCRSPELPMPDWLREGNIGTKTDPKAATYAKPNAGTAKWTSSFKGPNGEPIVLPHGVVTAGNHEERLPRDVEAIAGAYNALLKRMDNIEAENNAFDVSLNNFDKQVERLHGDSIDLDRTVDKLSHRVDGVSDEVIGLKLALERIEARLKRLEVARG